MTTVSKPPALAKPPASCFTKLRGILGKNHTGWLQAIWQRSQYGGVEHSFAPPAPGTLLDPEGKLVHNVFVRGEPARLEEVTQTFGSALVQYFLENGLCIDTGGLVQMTGLRLFSAFGFQLFAGTIPASGVVPSATVHFGNDSIVLADVLQYQPRVQRALDLCAGGGIQSLVLSRVADEVTAVEYVPLVAEIGCINIALAGLEDRITMNLGDLFQGAEDRPYDLIVCNPPFAATLADPVQDRAGAAGIDGLNLVRAVLRGAATRLAPAGRLFLVADLMGDCNGPFFEDELRRLAMDCSWRVHMIQVQEPVPVERLQIPMVIAEYRAQRINEKLVAARKLEATHFHFMLITAAAASPAGCERVRAYAGREAQMRTAIEELRKIRKLAPTS